MSFVNVQSEALTTAASELEGVGSAVTAQNAAAAEPTTAVIPAAADQVSALQAALFSTYGHLYQQVSAQATAIHQMFVNTLNTSAGSYGTTEAANTASANSSGSGISGLLGSLFGSSSSSSSSSGLSGFLGNTGVTGLSGNAANMVNVGAGNWASAMSDVIGLGGGGLIDAPAEAAANVGGLAGFHGALLASAVPPATPAGLGAAPVLASVGQAPAVGGLSVPPSWAPGEIAPMTGAAPTTLAGWTTAAPAHAPLSTVPASMPGMATAGKAGGGFGAPRYGAKPIVMPKPKVV